MPVTWATEKMAITIAEFEAIENATREQILSVSEVELFIKRYVSEVREHGGTVETSVNITNSQGKHESIHVKSQNHELLPLDD